MAVDEVLLESHLKGDSPPVLRLYGFKPAAVTIGLNQKAPAALFPQCAVMGLDVARRPTGGRAVLHLNDLTYSFVGSSQSETDDGFLPGSVTAAYKQICRGLIAGFNRLGPRLTLGKSDVSYRDFNDCFAVTTGADLQFDGHKMVGSAQLRRRHGVLQHGSILLNQDQNLARQLFGSEREVGPDSVRHANLFEVLGRDVEIDVLAEALKAGFSEVFSSRFETRPLSDHEIAEAERLQSRFLIDQPV